MDVDGDNLVGNDGFSTIWVSLMSFAAQRCVLDLSLQQRMVILCYTCYYFCALGLHQKSASTLPNPLPPLCFLQYFGSSFPRYPVLASSTKHVPKSWFICQRPETKLCKNWRGPCLFHHGFCGLWGLSLFTLFSIFDEFRSLTGCLKEVRWRGQRE